MVVEQWQVEQVDLAVVVVLTLEFHMREVLEIIHQYHHHKVIMVDQVITSVDNGKVAVAAVVPVVLVEMDMMEDPKEMPMEEVELVVQVHQ